MSYDLVFLPKPPGQSWDEALEAARELPGGHLEPQVWPAVVAGVREILGDVTLSENGAEGGLTHEPTGIQVSCLPHEAAVTVPYWYTGEKAEAIVRAMYQIGHVVAAATGFAGYDPQTKASLAEAESRVEAAVAVFDRAAATLSRITSREYFRVYFTGTVTLADAAQRLRKMVVAERDDRLTVQWDADGPTMWVTFSAAPRVAVAAAKVAEYYRLPGLAELDRQFEVSFDDLDEVLDEINTLIEVQAHLQELTGGYVVRSWNDEVSPPED